MTLTRFLLAWVVVAAWYALLDPFTGPRARPLRTRIPLLAAETLLLTMFAALWFGSLGHGGWWLLFLVLGALIEGPVRLRHRSDAAPDGMRPWLKAALAVGRFVIAGGLLSWRLS